MKELIALAESKGYDGIQHMIDYPFMHHLILADIQKWLRDEKGCHIAVQYYFQELYGADIELGYCAMISLGDLNENFMDYEEGFRVKYEQALQEGVKKALALID